MTIHTNDRAARIYHPYSAAIDKDLRGSLLSVSDPINPPRISNC
jgi:hypothetical protein